MGSLGAAPGGAGDNGDGGEPASGGETAPVPRLQSESARKQIVAAAVALAIVAVGLPPLLLWQSDNQQKALSLSNMRRVAGACLVYAQDWDERFPPPLTDLPDRTVLAWPRLVRQYVVRDESFVNPSNPVKPFAENPVLRDPMDGHPIDSSYAFNRRFWNVFGQGPFPVGNLEIPEQTVLLVEAGRMAVDPRHPRPEGLIALDTYGDTTDRFGGLSPYPSVHGDRADVVAADGHGIVTRVLFYIKKDGPHDSMLGRFGDDLYNWNAGHPNGRTDTPAHE